MKKIISTILVLIIFIIVSANVFAQTTKSVLFLGNSYTNVNNLPQMVADVATSVGDNLIFDSNTPGGYTLQGHSTNTTSLNKIKLGNWDFVVLQEQSQMPSFPNSQVETSVFPYAHYLDSVVNKYNTCGETMFYMTWGKKNGDAGNCGSFPPLCTYAGMDSLLHLRYMMMADSNNAVVSPVGAVWKYIRENYPLIELYQTDESHPSLAGSYAAACCFYTSIFKKNPTLITNDYTLPAADAANIRAAVKTIVYDAMLNWYIGEYDPVANFSFTIATNNLVTFNNLSKNATSYKWNFGDGSTSTTENINYTYALNGDYSVKLIANYCNKSDSITISVNANTITTTTTTTITTNTTNSIDNQQQQNSITLYPNPASEFVNVKQINANADITSIVIKAINGQEVIHITTNSTEEQIDLKMLKKGFYFIEIQNQKNKTIKKLIVE